MPANNFTAAIPKLGYMGIKKIFDDHKIQYNKRTIVQASDLEEKLEKLGLHPDNCTIVSVDAVDFYPSVKFKLVKKGVNHYASPLPPDDKEVI